MNKSYWDNIAGIYDTFERIYNKHVYDHTGELVAEELEPEDLVLECACGTGSITVQAAEKCRRLIATDYSVPMLRQAEKNCAGFDNVSFYHADMMKLNVPDERFDKVIAGNVIHILSEPYEALAELWRVCRTGGKIILPTYVNGSDPSQLMVSHIISKLGANFMREFTVETYKDFVAGAGYENVSYKLAEGRMTCAIAVITKQ
ncbi:MAG: class I SAM-dependent methyltransferase [Ruminococcus sp.]|nr:class I SAM-dependent methyltransferase [Ruminococcus sp.]